MGSVKVIVMTRKTILHNCMVNGTSTAARIRKLDNQKSLWQLLGSKTMPRQVQRSGDYRPLQCASRDILWLPNPHYQTGKLSSEIKIPVSASDRQNLNLPVSRCMGIWEMKECSFQLSSYCSSQRCPRMRLEQKHNMPYLLHKASYHPDRKTWQ